MKSNFLKIGSVSVALTASLIISGCSSSEASHHWGYEGEYNPANWGKISPICENGKLQTPINVEHVNVSAMLPKDLSHYFHFIGSLTTPPCSEGVKWFILQDRASLSKEQIEKFRKLYPNNVRPIQELNNRKVFFK